MEFLFRAFAAPDAAPVASAAAPAGDAGGGIWGMVMWIVILFAMFYFLIIMPQRKKDRQYKDMMNQLKVGDKVVTVGGIIGKITTLKDQTVEITVLGNTKLEVTRKSIGAILGKSTSDPNEAMDKK